MKNPRSHYTEYRQIFHRATGEVAPRIPEIEVVLKEKAKKSMEFEQGQIDNLKVKLANREKRLRLFTASYESADDSEAEFRETWRGQVPAAICPKIRGKKGSRVDTEPQEFVAEEAEEAQRLLKDAADMQVVSVREPFESEGRAPPRKKRKKGRRAPNNGFAMNDECALVMDNSISFSDLEVVYDDDF